MLLQRGTCCSQAQNGIELHDLVGTRWIISGHLLLRDWCLRLTNQHNSADSRFHSSGNQYALSKNHAVDDRARPHQACDEFEAELNASSQMPPTPPPSWLLDGAVQ